jgi:hypothetical protein
MTAAIARSLRPGGPPVPWPDLKLPNVAGMVIPPLQRLWSARRADT